MTLQLDGGNTIIGTEFIKLLATGSSNLATEQYVETAIINGGGGGGVCGGLSGPLLPPQLLLMMLMLLVLTPLLLISASSLSSSPISSCIPPARVSSTVNILPHCRS